MEVEAVLKIAYSNQKAENVCSWMGGWRDVKSRFKDCIQQSKRYNLLKKLLVGNSKGICGPQALP